LFRDTMFQWRSHRQYQDVLIEKDKVRILVDSLLLSPSSRNIFPSEYLLVDDKNVLKQLSKVRAPGSDFLAKAALGVVVFADPGRSDVWIEDSAISTTVLQLCAESLRLGSCWIQIRNRTHDDGSSADEYVKDLLGIPSDRHVECIVALGHPIKKAAPHEASELQYSRIHVNRYQNAYKPE
jgi:nitroreductase